MKTKVRVLDSFIHGRDSFVRGDEPEFALPEAEELQKAGLVEIAKAGNPAEKAAPAPQNKMDPTPANKAAAAPKSK